ncbi:MAG: hypothetical protein JSS02_29655 [Planctomycetes bacterium]|nr:hypothetical protein [Planctomycetota bacterium]
MDTITLVENQIDDGQRLLDRLAQPDSHFPVLVAAWVKPESDDEESPWTLYIASPLVDEGGPAAAYREVNRARRSIEGFWISDSEIKLIGANHPFTKGLQELLLRYPGRTATRSRRASLGGTPMEEVYVYPGPSLHPFAEIKRRFPSAAVFAVKIPGGSRAAEALETIRLLTGKVNAHEFEGKAPETLLLMGPEGSTSQKSWDLLFVYRPEGWNTFYNASTQTWETVVLSTTGNPIYEPADFTALEALIVRDDNMASAGIRPGLN